MMKLPSDLALIDRNGQLAALVEVKKIPGITTGWAAQFRRNLLADGNFPITPFFFLVTPDKIYAWKSAQSENAMPDYEAETEPILRPYFERMNYRSASASGETFEAIVEIWLGDFVRLMTSQGTPSVEFPEWFEQSGFSQVVKNGRIAHEFAA